MNELTPAAKAEIEKQNMLDNLAIAKAFPNASENRFQNNTVWVSSNINLDNFTDIEFESGFKNNNPTLGINGIISGRLFKTIKRPGRPAIKVYSHKLYSLTVDHVINMVNSLPSKKIIEKLGYVLRMQESKKIAAK